jgi:signal transduction histidine kinase
MRMAARGKARVPAGFEEEYASLLREYASGGGEAALGKVYELGRRAINEQKSIVEIASLHHQALQGLIAREEDEKRRMDLLEAGASFLAECLSPYEMAHRGYQDAVKALRQLNETLEQEIKRIAYAVHDEAGQLLVAVHLALAEMAREFPASRQQIDQIERLLKEVEGHLRRYSHELRPTILDDLGWIPAVRFLAEGVSKRAGLQIHVEATISGRLPSTLETTLYRVVQEALNNAVKHAKPKNVWIRAWQNKRVLNCSVHDDGVGFDLRHLRRGSGQKGLGLVAMQERVSAIGGTLQIESCPGRGTEISLQLSLEDSHGNSCSSR